MEFLQQYHLLGLVIGVSTFLVIGLFHPVVIKCEYYFGTRCWWWFLLLGLLCVVLSLSTANVLLSTLLGVVAFSSFWSIGEIFEQQQRVKRGWFPRNPRRRYPWDRD
ncbi:MAG: DUF4491 family protein [Pseudoflavonifractor sp.]|nr:DUF4491 family protein [Pseudoflavonifractor sp.]